MKDVKMPTSRSYQDYLISSLKNPDRAAGNIAVALEFQGKDPQPDMLRLRLKDVMEAREQINNLSEEAKQSYEKLDKILSETGGTEIYSLVYIKGLSYAYINSILRQQNYHCLKQTRRLT